MSSAPWSLGANTAALLGGPQGPIQWVSALSSHCSIFSLFLGSFSKSHLVLWSMHRNKLSFTSVYTHTQPHLAYLTQGMRRDTEAQHEQTVQLHLGKSDPGISLPPNSPTPKLVSPGSWWVCALGKSTVDWWFMKEMPPCPSKDGTIRIFREQA